MKWKMTSDGRYKMPDLTKGWKTRWLVAGILLGIFAPGFAYFFYSWRMPNIPTVRKVAVKWSLPGALIGMAAQYGLSFLF